MEGPSFTFISQNVASSHRVERIADILKRKQPDILFLQEVTLTTSQIQDAVQALKYKCESNVDIENPNTPGTAIVWSASLPVPEVTSIVTCQLQTLKVGSQTFFNIYAPSGSENRRARALLFTRDMFPHLLQPRGGLLPILAGDWNCLIAPSDTTANYQEKYCKDLDTLVKTFSYQDVFRSKYPHVQEFTFHRASCAPSRLDRIYFPPHLNTSLISVFHLPGLADHWGVEVKFELELARVQLPPKEIKTHWKLNSSIMKNSSFIPQFTKVFTQLEEDLEEFEDVADWWDLFAKPGITSFCKSFSVSLAKQRNCFKKFLFALLRGATKRRDWNLVTQTKEKLQGIIAYEAHSLIVRSKEKQNAEEEAASLYHMAKMSCNGLGKMKVNEGETIGFRAKANMMTTEDPVRIEKETVGFMDALLNGRQNEDLEDTGTTFKPDDSQLNEFLSKLSQLSRTSSEGLVKPLTEEEVEEAVKASKNGKSPGLDGISYEFYKVTWPVIRTTFTKVLQAQLDRVRLTDSGKHGATRLISKVENVPNVSELRPITLLQVDYRLLSKCLATRLHSVMHEVVDSGQLGVPTPGQGGAILSGIYKILSSIDYVNSNNMKAYIASFDNVKAYDRANTMYLEKVTEKMDFPPLFRAWMKMLHQGATTRIILPNGLSKEIKVTFSFRQGDPIAGDLYCITLEPLLVMLRTKLTGLCFFNFVEKDTTYMDDTQLLSEEEEDLVIFDQVMKAYEKQSGAMLSRSKKSVVMGLGLWEGKSDWPKEVPWLRPVQQMKIFGIVVCPQYNETVKQTWELVLRGLQKTLFSWGSRALNTLQQRVEVLQTFALSKLWYSAQVLPLPAQMVKKIESASSAFIFRGRPERLKLAELQNPKEEGGLGLVCVATKAECLLLRQSLRILAQPTSDCYLHLGHWLGFALKETFPQLEMCQQALQPRFSLHKSMLEVLEEGLLREEYDPKNLNSVTTSIIYKGRAADIVPPPKIQLKNPGVDFVGLVYPRLSYNILEAEARDVLFCLVHNIQPTRQRMFEQNRVQSASCPNQECLGRNQDIEHMFSSCSLVSEAWVWLRTRLLRHFPSTVGASGTSSEDFLLLRFPMDVMDKEIVWLVGNYCNLVLSQVLGKKRKLTANHVAAFLNGKLLATRTRAVVVPQIFTL